MFIPDDLLPSLDHYRQVRRAETGKLMTRQTAVVELLTKSLEGVSPPAQFRTLDSRLLAMESRIEALERKGA